MKEGGRIFRMKKQWNSVVGNGNIGFKIRHEEGDLFYEETKEDKNWPNGKITIDIVFHPFKGGYPVWERDYGKDNPESFYFIDEYLELVEETDKSKDYFLDKKYSQAEVDEMMKTNKAPFRKYLCDKWLENNGWVKDKMIYTKGTDTISYDGAIWLFNGKRVEFVDEIKSNQ